MPATAGGENARATPVDPPAVALHRCRGRAAAGGGPAWCRVVLAAALILSCATPLRSQTADDWLRKSQAARFPGRDYRTRFAMLIEEPDGTRLRRKGVAFRRTRDDGLADRLFVITAPEHLKGLALLSEDRHDAPAVQYLYVPAYRRARRVALHAAGDAYVGSNFTYADFGRVHIEAGEHKLQGAAELSGHACVVIETITADRNLPYARLLSTLDRETALPLRSEYYDRDGRLTRVGSLDEIAAIGGWPTPIRISMMDRRTGGRSTITLRDVHYDVGLDQDLFTVAHLEQPPPVE